MRAVFATDLSEANEAAIRSRTCLECLDRIGIGEVHLVAVLSSNVHYGVPGFDVDDQRRNALATQQRLFEREGFGVESHVVRGTPHRRINGLAERVDADVIIVGSRGQSPLEHRLIGSTARNVARTTVRPLLIERIVENDGAPGLAREHLFRRVLYGTDFSGNADRAFEQFQVLKNATQEATLLHVIGPEQRDIDANRTEAEGELAALAARLDEWGIDATTRIREGEPVDGILAEERASEPTLILLGSRGRSRLRRLLLGSVSERIVARADANVLLVPPTPVI